MYQVEVSDMQIEQMREFVTLAKLQSFTAAAKELFITQPTLSNHVRAIERELGFSLIDRSDALFSLTREGVAFFSSSMAILKEYDSMVADCKCLNSSLVSLRFEHTPCSSIFPKLREAAAAYEAEFGTVVEVLASNCYNREFRAQDLIDRDMIDVAFHYVPQSSLIAERYASQNPRTRSFLADRIKFWCLFRKDSPLASRRTVDLRSLDGLSMSYPINSKSLDNLDTIMNLASAHGAHLTPNFCQLRLGVRRSEQENLLPSPESFFFTFTPEDVLREMEDVVVLPLEDDVHMDIYALYHPSRVSESQRSFLAFLEAQCASEDR